MLLHGCGWTFLSADFYLDLEFRSVIFKTKVNLKSGGQESPPHTAKFDCCCSSKQLHLQEVTFDLRCENYTMICADMLMVQLPRRGVFYLKIPQLCRRALSSSQPLAVPRRFS